jgi:hypothetical protein
MGMHRMKNGNVFQIEGEGDSGPVGPGMTAGGMRMKNGNVFRQQVVQDTPPAPAPAPEPKAPVWEAELSPEEYLKTLGFEAANSELALAVLGVTREEAEILLAGGGEG